MPTISQALSKTFEPLTPAQRKDLQTQRMRIVQYLGTQMSDLNRILLHVRIDIIDAGGAITKVRGDVLELYRPFFEFTNKEQCGLLVQAVLHIMLLHPSRQGNRNQHVWTWACDLVVNTVINQHTQSICLPEGSLTFQHEALAPARQSHSDSKWAVEELYLWMLANLPRQEGIYVRGSQLSPGDAAHDTGTQMIDLGIPPDMESSSDAIDEQRWTRLAHSAMAGASSNSLVMGLRDHLPNPQIPWTLKLRRSLRQTLTTRFVATYSRPSRRYLAGVGPFEPSYIPAQGPRLVACVLDTSGSCWDPQTQGLFAAEVGAVSRQMGVDVLLIVGDTKVKNTVLIERGQTDLLTAFSKLEGGGGSDMVPGIEYALEQKPSCVIVLSDGHINRFPETCPVPLFWVLNSDVTPPIGQALYLKDAP